MSKSKMSFGVRCLWIMCRLFALLPRWIQYGCVAKVIYFVLRYIVRYRKALILKQLSGSFPERSECEILDICNKYYRSLSEFFVGTIALAGMSEEECREVLVVNVPEHIQQAVGDGHFVILTSHHNFWEYAQFINLYFPNSMMVCAYHPLTSKVMDELFYHLRLFPGTLPVPSSNLIRYFLQHRNSTNPDDKRMILGLVADQNAPPMGEVHWYNFLNRQTLFFEGGEQLALKFHLPVLYLGMKREKAGRYSGSVELIYDGKQSVEKFEITQRYVELLERDIRNQPEGWMWSHRRWKYYPDPETGKAVYCRTGV